MANVKGLRIKRNPKGFAELLLSQEVQDDFAARASRIQSAAGEGHEVEVTRNRDRVVAFVNTATYEAREAEAEDRNLTRAIDAGR
ncbi:hypothetical protein [Microbacterium karelineae]|uniref:hypothetical protein n=1 Tax=Microbacterium karelineae TaxID=2654283 RepID=UPI0012EA8FD3|nr:hypothetical protein [Microbacterium karelineae]